MILSTAYLSLLATLSLSLTFFGIKAQMGDYMSKIEKANILPKHQKQ